MMRAALSIVAVALLFGCATPGPAGREEAVVRRVVVEGAELTYVEQGAGELVVFLHGTATDYRVWESLRRALADDVRFVAYSRRHHAPNRPPDAGASYTVKQHAADLVGLIHALGEKRAHVVAVSLAARTAAYAAMRYPGTIRSVTLSDGFLAMPTTDEGKRDFASSSARFDRLFAAIRSGSAQDAVSAYVDLASPPDGWMQLPTVWKGYYLDNAHTLPMAVTDPTAREVDCSTLRTISVPVLVLAGADTPPAARVSNEALLDCLPAGAEYARVPRAAHYWYVDNPVDAARILRSFFRRH